MEMDESGGGVWDQRNTLVFPDIPLPSSAPSPTHGKGMSRVAARMGGVHARATAAAEFSSFSSIQILSVHLMGALR